MKIRSISVLQTEYSLWAHDVEAEIRPVCRGPGIGFVVYNPLRCGFVMAIFKKAVDLPQGDWRRTSPRFKGEVQACRASIVE